MALNGFRISPKWSASKEEIWDKYFEPLREDVSTSHIKKLSFKKMATYVAAASVVGIGLYLSIAFFYTIRLQTMAGEHLSLNLPDNSTVQLNAATTISYKPLWWTLQRNVQLEGEAYFSVEKGAPFTVSCQTGEVTVLGTTFNVKSREGDFHVTCLTGKVKVVRNSKSVLLTANMETSLGNDDLKAVETTSANERIYWVENKFIFDKVPLEEVLKEIELQYGVKIERPHQNDFIYSGQFNKTKTPDEALIIVGKPFGLKLKLAN